MSANLCVKLDHLHVFQVIEYFYMIFSFSHKYDYPFLLDN